MADSELRQRPSAAKELPSDASPSSNVSNTKVSKAPSRRIGVLDIIRVLAGVFLLSSVTSYFVTGSSIFWNKRPAWTQPNRLLHMWHGDRQFTLEELKKYDGTNKYLPIYIAVNGTVFDVTVSPHYYGPGGGYHVFAGRDATRSFVSGCFDEDLTADLRGVEEMFMPLDLDAPPKLEEGATDAERKAARKLWKLRRERAAHDGKLKVKQTIEHWRKMFDKGPNGKYFKVGEVKLPDDWKEKRGPIRTLCKRAVEQRPKTNKWSTWTEDDE